jgi:hypothetical protein
MIYPYIWQWHKFPRTSWGKDSTSRKGQSCRVVLTATGPGPRNALVEFEDGARFVVTNAARRYAMRKPKQLPLFGETT